MLGRRETAICRATVDGAVWIGHIKRPGGIKLPATLAFPEAAGLPELPLAGCWKAAAPTWQDIAYEEAAGVGFLSFEPQAISHLTGTTSLLAMALAQRDVGMAAHWFWIIAAFVFGAMLSGLLLRHSALRLGRRYGVTGLTGCYELSAGEVETSVDAGFYRLASLGNKVWVDADKDGSAVDDVIGMVGRLLSKR